MLGRGVATCERANWKAGQHLRDAGSSSMCLALPIGVTSNGELHGGSGEFSAMAGLRLEERNKGGDATGDGIRREKVRAFTQSS